MLRQPKINIIRLISLLCLCYIAIVHTIAFQLAPFLPYKNKKYPFLYTKEASFGIYRSESHHKKNNFNSKNQSFLNPSHGNKNNHQEKTNHPPFIANKGKTATFMLYWPSISTFTLLKGWNDTTTLEFKAAIDEVIDKNPILTGCASKSGLFTNVQIIITPGAFPTESHNFVNIIDLVNSPFVPDLTKMNPTQILNFMDDFISPIVPKAESVIESISNGSPLFGIDLILLPDGFSCYVVKMSHCVGDGVCYFKIMEQINHCFNNSNKKYKDKIDWNNEEISTHEVFPSRFSTRDSQIMYGIPFLLGLLRNVFNMKKQKKGYFLFSKEKVNEKKKEFMALHNSTISSNDLITSALCEANLSSDVFAFTMNMRNLHCKYGGNFHNEVPFAKAAALSKTNNPHNPVANPIGFREVVKRGYYYDTDEIPMCPFIFGTVGRISSLSTIQKLIKKDEMKLVCHAMLSSFVSNVPMDTAFASSMDDDFFVVLHNFREFNKNTWLFKEITAV